MSARYVCDERFGQVVGALVAVCAVTATSFIWRLLQIHSPQMVLVVYVVSASLMVVGGYLVFRIVVSRSYAKKRRLTSFPLFLQFLIGGVVFAFPCIYNPYDWAWSRPGSDQVSSIQIYIGWGLVGVGLVILIIAMAWLGLSRSMGQESRSLERTGPYRFTRNPQLMGGALLVIGYIILWPSWYALGWLVLFTGLMHMMIFTEEEHLYRIHGERFLQYCKQVPRYLGFPLIRQ